ncbi:hypothetical protein MW871_05160 [Flavobacterium sp. I-SCBP12n]|uniref:Uncharacterized protein n=1 Tax=Flavobacterium pygoscelis TaxID=2893176 RepID=A0A9X1XRM2_9FLAO|nr:hypothetical protein [Flavobacterium pygoscelis]MCK8141276.1 hypothetical protein [Flavobacterium pygoscelis]
MVEFKIFNKVDKLYIGRSFIINTLALLFVCPSLIGILFKNININTTFAATFGIIACLLVLSGIFIKLFVQFKYEKLKGYFEGTIEFHENKIKVDKIEYEIEKIKKIEIYAGDYKGKWKPTGKTEYDNALSNGVGNVLRIIMENENETITIYFEQNVKNEIKIAEKQLVNYYKEGKIRWLHLIDILAINDYDEIQQFKSTIR